VSLWDYQNPKLKLKPDMIQTREGGGTVFVRKKTHPTHPQPRLTTRRKTGKPPNQQKTNSATHYGTRA
jgi:hypothetical protein